MDREPRRVLRAGRCESSESHLAATIGLTVASRTKGAEASLSSAGPTICSRAVRAPRCEADAVLLCLSFDVTLTKCDWWLCERRSNE